MERRLDQDFADAYEASDLYRQVTSQLANERFLVPAQLVINGLAELVAGGHRLLQPANLVAASSRLLLASIQEASG